MAKSYIDADKLIVEIERWRDKAKEKYNKNPYSMGRCDALAEFRNHIVSLQEEQPMPNSTQLIELWRADKEMLKEKDFRGDPWRLAYNAFMCGFGRGIAVNRQEQPEVDFEKDIDAFFDKWDKNSNGAILDENGARVTIETIKGVVKHFLNARKED